AVACGVDLPRSRTRGVEAVTDGGQLLFGENADGEARFRHDVRLPSPAQIRYGPLTLIAGAVPTTRIAVISSSNNARLSPVSTDRIITALASMAAMVANTHHSSPFSTHDT